ncbi:MAG: hypothetical protein ACOYL5_17270 [Phototrophicaceae bacterium]
MEKFIADRILDRLDDDDMYGDPSRDEFGEDRPKEDEGEDRLSFFVNVMLALVALFGTGVVYRASTFEGGFAQAQAVMAVFNRGNTQVANEATSSRNLSLYATYRVNSELAALMAADLDATPEEQRPALEADLEDAEQIAFQTRFFFPGRYLTADGSYDSTREISERYARADQELDLNPDPHVDFAAKMDDAAFAYGRIFIWLAVVLSLYALALLFHERLTATRWLFAISGTLAFTYCLIAAVLIEVAQ